MTAAADRHQIRRDCRAKRRELSANQQASHAESAARLLATSGLLRGKRRVSAYFATDGELDPGPLAARMHQAGIKVFYPALERQRRMTFWKLDPGEKISLNRIGIWEPFNRRGHPAPAWSLSLVLLPLVAFDSHGTRLGMGGGYYDVYLARLHKPRPLLVGYAHACQEVAKIDREPWDVPLDAVVTEASLHLISRRAQSKG